MYQRLYLNLLMKQQIVKFDFFNWWANTYYSDILDKYLKICSILLWTNLGKGVDGN